MCVLDDVGVDIEEGRCYQRGRKTNMLEAAAGVSVYDKTMKKLALTSHRCYT